MGFLLLPTAPTSFAAGVAVPVLMEKMEGRDSRCEESNTKRQDPGECIQYLITKGRVPEFIPSLHYQMLSMLGWKSPPLPVHRTDMLGGKDIPRDSPGMVSVTPNGVKVTRVAEVRVCSTEGRAMSCGWLA